MNTLLYQIAVPFATAFLGAFAGWFFKRKRLERENKALDSENQRKEITNIDAAVATWQKVVDALELQIAKLLEQRKEDNHQIAELSREVCDLRREVNRLQSKLAAQTEYQAKIERYEKLLDAHGIAY